MKKKLNEFVNSRNSLTNGFLALMIVALVALGCTCKDGFNLGGKDSSANKDKTTEPINTPDEKTEQKIFEKADASKGEVPSDEELQEMVKTTLLNFNDAIQQKDFSDFHKTISKIWQKQTTPKTFEDGFKEFMDKKINIEEIRSKEATFSPKPQVTKESGVDHLIVKGSYPTSPIPSTFELKFIPEDKEWKLFYIEVYSASK